jgi:uncharacterized protein (DUF58 family)
MSSEEYQQQSIYSVGLTQVLAGVFLMIALLNAQRGLIFLLIILLVIMTGARLWSGLSLRHLSIGARVDRHRLFPGETLQATIRIENRKWLPLRFHVEMFAADGLQPQEDDPTRGRTCGLLWHQGMEISWKLTALQRGVFPLGSSRLRGGDFFGFFAGEMMTQGFPREILVYPRIVALKPVALPGMDFFGIPGACSPVQDPVYILGTRDYQCRQPSRNIHWKASARRSRIQEKIFEPSAQAKVLLLLDVASFAAGSGAAFERTLEAVASLALQYDRKGYALGFLSDGVVQQGPAHVPVSHGAHRLTALLDVLARLRMQVLQPLSQLLPHYLFRQWGLSAVCFAYEENAATHSIRTLLKHRKIPLASVVCRIQGPGHTREADRRGVILGLDEMRIETAPP